MLMLVPKIALFYQNNARIVKTLVAIKLYGIHFKDFGSLIRKSAKMIKTLSTKAKVIALSAAVVAAGGVGTMALLTDTSTTAIEITSASLDLNVNGSAGPNYTVTMDSSNLRPGETRTGDITVRNDSTIPITVDATQSPLVDFTSSLKDGATEVSHLTLQKGESRKLTLSITLPGSITVPPANQTLNVSFHADQLPA